MHDASASGLATQLALHAKRLEKESASQLAARAALVDAIGQSIHALQRERGASSVFLASRGERLADVRATSIEQTRGLQAQLRSLFAEHAASHGASARMVALMAWVCIGLDALDELRVRTDRHALTAHDAVVAYSRLIAGQIELVSHVADAALLPRISRSLVALLHLIQGKEAAGQERALGALLFASGRCTEEHRQRIVHLVDAQERDLKVYADFADEPLRVRWERQQLTPAAARLERLRRTLCSARPGAALDPELSDAWFEVSSERIAELWQLQVGLVQRLRAECESHIHAAERELRDAEGLVHRLRAQPPAHAHAVEQFLDITQRADAVPAVACGATASLNELLHAQAARLARMEVELDTARRALHERKLIERAKGVLMSRLGMSEDQAFRALQKTSMDQNRRLVDVAEATLSLPDIAFARAAPAPRS